MYDECLHFNMSPSSEIKDISHILAALSLVFDTCDTSVLLLSMGKIYFTSALFNMKLI